MTVAVAAIAKTVMCFVQSEIVNPKSCCGCDSACGCGCDICVCNAGFFQGSVNDLCGMPIGHL